MKILISGGSGFIGKNLVENLADAHTIFAPASSLLDFRHRDQVETYVKKHHVEFIIHSAIRGGPEVVEDTLRMYDSVLNVSHRVQRVIHIGSGAEYGKQRDIKKISEKHFGEIVPTSSFGFAKYVCSKWSKTYPNVITLRPFGVYGKYENYLVTFISNAIVKNIFKLPIKIKQDCIFDYIWIDDLVSIVRHFVQTPRLKHAEYNVTPDDSIKLSTVAQLISEEADAPSQITIAEKGFNHEYTGDNARLRAEMPQFLFTTPAKGIASLMHYYQARISDIDKSAIMQDDYYDRIRPRAKR